MLTDYLRTTTERPETLSDGTSSRGSMTPWSRGTPDKEFIGFFPQLSKLGTPAHLDADVAAGDHFIESQYIKTHFVVTGNKAASHVCTRESDPISLDWYFDALSQNEGGQLSVAKLSAYIRGINSIIYQQQYATLEKVLHDATARNASSHVLLAFARATYPVRSKVRGWKTFLTRVVSALERSGKDSGRLLKGMI